MNDFDKIGRYLFKCDPAGFLAWLVGGPIEFHAWIDCRRLALTDQGDLTQDLIAACRVADGYEALCVELQAVSAADTALRLFYGYMPRLAGEPGGLPVTAVSGIVVNFTGPPQVDQIRHVSAFSPACRWEGQVLQCTLREMPADELLTAVRLGRATPWLLGWLPLLHGGDQATIVTAWGALAAGLPSERDRGILGSISLTFAELAGRSTMWEAGLEGWNVLKSQYLERIREEVREEGREEGRAVGLAEGREVGRTEEARSILLRQGRQKFGRSPSKRQQQELADADLARLESLSLRLLAVETWAELLAPP